MHPATYHSKHGAHGISNENPRHPAFFSHQLHPRTVVTPEQIGDGLGWTKVVRVCNPPLHTCSELSEHEGAPWCDYYGAQLQMASKGQRRRCAECVRCRGR